MLQTESIIVNDTSLGFQNIAKNKDVLNATFHKNKLLQNKIKEASHILPPYSPNINQLEQKWAQAKSKKKKTFLRY